MDGGAPRRYPLIFFWLASDTSVWDIDGFEGSTHPMRRAGVSRGRYKLVTRMKRSAIGGRSIRNSVCEAGQKKEERLASPSLTLIAETEGDWPEPRALLEHDA